MTTESAAQVRVIEETSAYWRVLFDYPPFNIVDPPYSKASRICSPEWTPAPAYASWYSRARILSSTLPTRFDRQDGEQAGTCMPCWLHLPIPTCLRVTYQGLQACQTSTRCTSTDTITALRADLQSVAP
jgi:hypothetical protein